jgi:hypothetical protein
LDLGGNEKYGNGRTATYQLSSPVPSTRPSSPSSCPGAPSIDRPAPAAACPPIASRYLLVSGWRLRGLVVAVGPSGVIVRSMLEERHGGARFAAWSRFDERRVRVWLLAQTKERPIEVSRGSIDGCCRGWWETRRGTRSGKMRS